MREEKTICCKWEERESMSQYYIVGCIDSPVNVFKLSRKRGLSLVNMFTRCPFCGRKVQPIFNGAKK